MNLPKYSLLELTYIATLTFMVVMDVLYRNTFSKAFVTLGNVGISGVKIAGVTIGSAHPFHFLIKLDESIKKQIENGKAWSERGVIYALNQLVDALALFAGTALALGLALDELAKWAVHAIKHTVTRVEHNTIVRKVVTAPKVAAQITAKQFAHLTTRVAHLEKEVARIAHATAGAIAQPFPRIKTIENELTGLKHNYKKLLGLFTFAGAFALLVRAVGREMASLLKCGKVKQVAKDVCAFDSRWLNALLAGFALIYVSEGLIPFAKDQQKLIDDFGSGVQHFWKASAIGSGGDRALGSAGLNS